VVVSFEAEVARVSGLPRAEERKGKSSQGKLSSFGGGDLRARLRRLAAVVSRV